MEIFIGYPLDIKGYIRISLDISVTDSVGYLIGYQLDNQRISLMDIMWINMDIIRISSGYLPWRCDWIYMGYLRRINKDK
jgi:hypothetical protein